MEFVKNHYGLIDNQRYIKLLKEIPGNKKMKKISFTWLFRKFSSEKFDDFDYFTRIEIIAVLSFFLHHFHFVIYGSSEKLKSMQ
jgi:hypothetical protein